MFSLKGKNGAEVGVPDSVAEVRHLGVLLDLLVSTCDVVGDPLDPLEVGVAGVSGEMGQVEVIWPK